MPSWLGSFSLSHNLFDYHHTLLGELPSPLFRECSAVDQGLRNNYRSISVPILLLIAGSIFIFGQDHPSGRWEERPNRDTVYIEKDDLTSSFDFPNKDKGLENARVNTHPVQEVDVIPLNLTVDNAVKGSPNLVTYIKILTSPMTWLPPLAYMTTFGLELAIDSNMGNVLFSLFNKKRPGFTQTQAGYYTSIL